MSVHRHVHRALACLAMLALTASGARAAASAAGSSSGPGLSNPVLQAGARAEYRQGEVFVKFKHRLPQDGAGKASGSPAIDAIFQRHAVASIERVARKAEPPRKAGDVDMTRVYRLTYLDGADALEVARELAARPEVEYAEPRFVHKLDLIPNDTNWASQSAYMLKMAFPTAWDVTQGGSGNVVIGIADGGSDWDHTDLLANVWSNSDEIPGNLIDDDNNGFVDDIRGWNFANGTNDPTGLPATPNAAYHGTHVAGIACATANNLTGVAGASFNAKFMPICVAAPDADGPILFGFEGIIYAAENDADVVNCSWGGTGAPSAFEQEVIDYAYGLGTVVVAAAGNTGANQLHFPSAYEHVLAVANVTNTDLRNTGTTFGPWVDVSAQGTNIFSTGTIPLNGYGSLTGTSMSSPHAAAACALVKTRWPGYSPEQVMQRVRVTSDPIDTINPSAYRGNLGYGRINANQALTKNTPAISVTGVNFTTTDGDQVIEPSETVTLNLQVTNWLASCTGVDFRLRENSLNATPVDSVATLASIDSLQSLALTPISLSISPSAPLQHPIIVTLAITTASPVYTDRSKFLIIVLPTFATHNANNVDCTVTSVGKMGYAVTAGGNGTDGIGFHFDGSANYLFEGSLMIGTGPTTVSDGARTTGSAQDDDFQTVVPNGIPVITEPAHPFDEVGFATFTDALAATPLGLRVQQQSIEMAASPNDDFIVLRYTIANTSGVARNGVRVGWFCDWDVDGGNYFTNSTGFDAGRDLMYVFDTGEGPEDYVGVMTLSSLGTTAARGIVNDQALAPDWGVYDAYTEQEKWETLSIGPIHTAVGPEDVSIGLGTGPYDIPAGGTVSVAFAFLGGTNLADLQANADAAAAFFATISPTDTGEEPGVSVPRAVRLDQNTPNPFNPSTEIAFDLPRDMPVVLKIFGVDGRVVRTLVDGPRSAGRNRVRWDGMDDAGHAMPSGLYLYRFEAEGKSIVRKMHLVK